MNRRFLFFSTEAQHPSGPRITKLYYPVENKFNEMYAQKYAGEELENITIVFECKDENLPTMKLYKERNYISRKNKYADIRLNLPYLQFIKADISTQKMMMWNVILRALNNIRQKKALKRIDEFEEDLKQIYWSE